MLPTPLCFDLQPYSSHLISRRTNTMPSRIRIMIACDEQHRVATARSTAQDSSYNGGSIQTPFQEAALNLKTSPSRWRFLGSICALFALALLVLGCERL